MEHLPTYHALYMVSSNMKVQTSSFNYWNHENEVHLQGPLSKTEFLHLKKQQEERSKGLVVEVI